MNNLQTAMETLESLVRAEMQNGRASVHVKGISLTRGARGMVHLQANVSVFVVEEQPEVVEARHAANLRY